MVQNILPRSFPLSSPRNYMNDVDHRHWFDLDAELNEWQRLGRRATMWIRDDDATRSSAPFRRLIALTAGQGVPIAVSVIPELLENSLSVMLDKRLPIDVLVHGYAHVNHEPEGSKKSEFGPHRPLAQSIREICDSLNKLSISFPSKVVEGFVPPWNRIDEKVIDVLYDAGYRMLSTFTPRSSQYARRGLKQVNCHVDIIDWRGTKKFTGVSQTIAAVLGHLSQRRIGMCDPAEPTGILTHHLNHDEDCWSFLNDFVKKVSKHPGQEWIRLRSLMDAK